MNNLIKLAEKISCDNIEVLNKPLGIGKWLLSQVNTKLGINNFIYYNHNGIEFIDNRLMFNFKKLRN